MFAVNKKAGEVTKNTKTTGFDNFFFIYQVIIYQKITIKKYII